MSFATILCGSADPDGVTKSMCDIAAGRFAGCDVFMLPDMDLKHCRDCGGCASGRCVIDDDMKAIDESLSHADILVLATPIHFSGPSSSLKTAMDRFQPHWHNRSIPHPGKCVGLMCGGSDEPNFDYTEHIFKAFCITVGMEYCGSLKIPGTDSGVVSLDEKVNSFLDGIIQDTV